MQQAKDDAKAKYPLCLEDVGEVAKLQETMPHGGLCCSRGL